MQNYYVGKNLDIQNNKEQLSVTGGVEREKKRLGIHFYIKTKCTFTSENTVSANKATTLTTWHKMPIHGLPKVNLELF